MKPAANDEGTIALYTLYGSDRDIQGMPAARYPRPPWCAACRRQVAGVPLAAFFVGRAGAAGGAA